MITAISRPAGTAALSEELISDRWHNPAFRAFWLLRVGFTAAPILFGADELRQ